MGTCKECRWWECPPEFAKAHYRSCSNPKVFVGLGWDDSAEATPHDGVGYYNSGHESTAVTTLQTGQDFGCIHFESAELHQLRDTIRDADRLIRRGAVAGAALAISKQAEKLNTRTAVHTLELHVIAEPDLTRAEMEKLITDKLDEHYGKEG